MNQTRGTYVYIRLKRPEGYEDVHPELVMEDAVKPAFEPEVVSYAVLRASILEEAERVCYDLGGGVTGYECASAIRELSKRSS
jgi:hypothetical protein